MEEYQSRDYCRANCHIQDLLDAQESNAEVKEILKDRNCRDNCKAYKFHQWLKDNGYEIIKDPDND